MVDGLFRTFIVITFPLPLLFFFVQMTSDYFLAFDIEATGPRKAGQIIGVGCSVVSNFVEVDSLLCKGYMVGKTDFEHECAQEFWKGKEELLEYLRVPSTMSVARRQRSMFRQVHEFRQKWEATAKREGKKLWLVSDNPVFDGGKLNQFTGDDYPFPYLATKDPDTGKNPYGKLYCSQTMYEAIIMERHPEYTKEWGVENFLKAQYHCPEMRPVKPHYPEDDAYEIAFNMNVLIGIINRTIKAKNTE